MGFMCSENPKHVFQADILDAGSHAPDMWPRVYPSGAMVASNDTEASIMTFWAILGLAVGLSWGCRPRKKRDGIDGWMVFWAWLALAIGVLIWSPV